jgi:hypothetical protein
MKRIILKVLPIVCIAFSSGVFAQGIGIGIKAGANFANQQITDISTDSRTGFHGGAYLTLAFSEKWAIQPEVLFSSKGSEIPNLNEVAQLDYFSIPVLLRWKPIGLISFHAGPQFSNLLSAVDKSGDSIKEDFKSSDFGLAMGAGVHLPLGINGGLRYVLGFTDVGELQNDSSIKNRTFQVYVGWTIFGAK